MIELIAAAVLTASSQVSEVTVYNDRAQVVRTAELDLKEGIQTVVFENLPEAVDSRGIQVEGSGTAVVLDVRFKNENYVEITDEAWQKLYAEQESLRDEQQAIQARIQRIQAAKAFLSRISEKVTYTSSKESGLTLDPESWIEMLDLHATRNAEYDEELMTSNRELKQLQNALTKLEADLSDAGAARSRRRRIVEVDLDAEPGPVELKLKYLVNGPSWHPAYDVRVDSRTRRMRIDYFGLVRQNTGEDWGDVTLKLSTARPSLGGQHPELVPWRITEQPVVRVEEITRYPQDWDVETGQRTAPVLRRSDLAVGNGGMPLDIPALGTRSASPSSLGTAVLFEVEGSCVIDSDNVEHRVAVSSMEMPSHFRYSCTPKLDQYVYLKALGTNPADYPLLPGKANVYLDDNYVATSELELVAPNEEFWAFLGVDESMKVEYKLLNKQVSQTGLTGRKERHTYEYLFKAVNTHATPEELIIFDQLPISGTEDLEVKLVKPQISGNSEELEINDEKRIKWFLVLDAGEEREVPFTFFVEGPNGEEVIGL